MRLYNSIIERSVEFMKHRCQWTNDDPLMTDYHDTEWAVPLHDDKKLFEFILLDSFQAGLSWVTILRKRQNFRLAFDDFDVDKIAGYDEAKFDELLQDAGIIRNRLKIRGTIQNAIAYKKIQQEFHTFDEYIWQFVGQKSVVNTWKNLNEIPSRSAESDLMSKDLRTRGFKFVGTTICYAFMQASGMVNDHLVSCFRYKEINKQVD